MEQKPTLLMMRGLPLSGKSDYALQWANSDQDHLRLSWTDMLRQMGGKYQKHRRGLAYEAVIHLAMAALRQGRSVVIDEENLNPKDYELLLKHLHGLDCIVQWHTMTASAQECKARNAELGHPIQDSDIDRKAERYKDYLQY